MSLIPLKCRITENFDDVGSSELKNYMKTIELENQLLIYAQNLNILEVTIDNMKYEINELKDENQKMKTLLKPFQNDSRRLDI